MRMKLSPEGVAFIKQWERFSPTVYIDQAGHPTIGYGHKILPHEEFTTITEEQAIELLKLDVLPIELYLYTRVFTELVQNEFDALVSFVYSIGVTEFAVSMALKFLQDAHYDQAANEFERWIHVTDPHTHQKVVSNGLVNRRRAEKLLFNSGEAV